MQISPWVISLIVTADRAVDAFTLLSNLNRPCFIIDVDAVQRWCSEQQTNKSDPSRKTSCLPIPPICLPSTTNECLVAMPIVDNSTNIPGNGALIFDSNLKPIDIFLDSKEYDLSIGKTCFGYIHCQVVKPSSSQKQHDTFLAQLNVALHWDEKPCTHDSEIHCTDNFGSVSPAVPAHLVLGLNNHHVVSYYWARSAGGGAAMEAPGIVVEQTPSGNAQLRWASEAGYANCNSNDGKRSEWVKFLKHGDQVQLRPSNIEAAIHHFREDIYGVSRSGRPLGSEPIVVCKWKIVSTK